MRAIGRALVRVILEIAPREVSGLVRRDHHPTDGSDYLVYVGSSDAVMRHRTHLMRSASADEHSLRCQARLERRRAEFIRYVKEHDVRSHGCRVKDDPGMSAAVPQDNAPAHDPPTVGRSLFRAHNTRRREYARLPHATSDHFALTLRLGDKLARSA